MGDTSVVPVPLPTPDTVELTPPSAEEVERLARGVASVAAPPAGLTDLQRALIEALFPALTDHAVDLRGYEPLAVVDLAEALRHRDAAFRTRVLQVTLLPALLLRPLPAEVADRLDELAAELGVAEGMLTVARDLSHGALGLAAFDFERNGYTAAWSPEAAAALHTARPPEAAWEQVVHDPELAARWAALGELPAGTLGRRVWELYCARGFTFPGLPGSAPPLLAQHDWVHVVADYGTTVESELEVFAFIARANDDLHAFSLLAMVVSLFETGYLAREAGLFESSPGRLTSNNQVAIRMADALRRGALSKDTHTGSDSVDYLLGVDWFELAELPVETVRQRFHITPKSDHAIAAGSVTPFGPGGISEYQLATGMAAAEAAGRPYDSYGATV